MSNATAQKRHAQRDVGVSKPKKAVVLLRARTGYKYFTKLLEKLRVEAGATWKLLVQLRAFHVLALRNDKPRRQRTQPQILSERQRQELRKRCV